jgi:transcriptional regulator with XRE-family HTH domain
MDQQAERRREAIRGFMNARGLTANQWCTSAQVPAAALYNFLRGDSKSLSQQTLEKLAKEQDVSVSELLSEDILSPARGVSYVSVIGQITEGSWFADFTWLELPEEAKFKISLPLLRSAAGAAGFVLRDESYDQLMPDGTIVVIAPISNFHTPLQDGDHVMYHRREGNKVERGLRQLKVSSGTSAQLISHSSVPEYYPTLDLEWPYKNRLKSVSWCTEPKHLEEAMPTIIGIVVGYYVSTFRAISAQL